MKKLVMLDEIEHNENTFRDLEFEYCGYSYTSGDYCGYGTLVMKKPNGKFIVSDLSHCSCFGPFDELTDDYTNEYTKEELNLENFSTEVLDNINKIILKCEDN